MISALVLASFFGATPAPIDLASAIRDVRRTFIEDGENRVSATPTHRVVSHADGSLELQGAQPLRITVQSVRRDRGSSCPTPSLSRVVDSRDPRTVRTRRACALEETWTNGPDGLAQAFTLQRPPKGSGGLALRLSIDGPWHHQDGAGHLFKGPGAAASLRYGSAFVVRDDGQRLAIAVVRVDGGLELRVPRSLVEAPGAFPMHIDPLLSTELPLDPTIALGPPPALEVTPAIAVNSRGVPLVVWVDDRRLLGTDLFGARINVTSGLVSDPTGIPLVTSPGSQLHPSVCGQGTGYLLAWDSPLSDGGAEVWSRTLGEDGGLSPEQRIAFGSEPSLAVRGDGGPTVIAWVDNSSTVRVAPMTSSMLVAFPRPPVVGPETSTRPRLAATNQSWLVAWESKHLAAPLGGIRAMGSTGSVVFELAANASAVPTQRPTVAIRSEPGSDEAFVFWEQGQVVAGARVFGTLVTPLPTFIGVSPALVRSSLNPSFAPSVGSFLLSGGTNYFQLRDLAVDGGTVNLPVGNNPNDLVLASAGKLYGAWTEASAGLSDVVGVVLPMPTGPLRAPFPFSQSANTQVLPHAAMRDDGSEGLAVWLDGANVIRGAKVSFDTGGLNFGAGFTVATSTQQIEDLDVASSGMGDQYLVVWRQGRTSIVGVRVRTGSGPGAVFQINLALPNAGPAVAWDEMAQGWVVAWSQFRVLGFDVVTRTVPIAGTTLGATAQLDNGAASDLDVVCLRGKCLVAWEESAANDIKARLLDGNNTSVTLRTPARAPAVTHDGQNFLLGWSSANGLSFAEVNFASGLATNLLLDVTPAPQSAIGRVSLAPGIPPIAAWTEVSVNEETNVYFERLDSGGSATRLAGGMRATLATAGVSPGSRGLVVYQRYEPAPEYRALRGYGTAFAFPFDPGLDAGLDAGVDAGLDAGSAVDAGMDAADAGTDGGEPADAGVMVFETSGCNCGSTSSAVPLLFLVLLAVRRRHCSWKKAPLALSA